MIFDIENWLRKSNFGTFLTAPHYSNFQNLVISYEYSWFLAKNLSNFASIPWKLHNRECHNLNTQHCIEFWTISIINVHGVDGKVNEWVVQFQLVAI